MLRSILSSTVLMASFAGAAGAQVPSLSAPKLLEGDDLFSAAAGSQDTPVLAEGDGAHLVVWTDLRSNPGFTLGGVQSDRDLWATRVDANGSPLDAAPIPISTQYGSQVSPDVAWNGTHWLVAWENQSPTQFFYATEVLATRVSADGAVLDDPPISVVTYESSSSIDFAMTANGADWCVVARGTSAGPETAVVARRIASDGTLPEPAPVPVHPSGGPLTFGLGVESAGSEYLVLFSQSSSLFARRLASDLTILGDIPSMPGLSVASNGTGYLVAWLSGTNYVVSPMTTDGVLLVPGGAPFSPTGSVLQLGSRTMGWDGALWWVSWQNALSGIRATRVTPTGAVLEPGGAGLDPAHEQYVGSMSTAGVDGGGARIVWQDNRVGGLAPNDILAGGFSATMSPNVGQPISLGLPTQTGLDLAAGDGGFLAVHRSWVSGGQRILAGRLDRFGNAIGAPVEIAAAEALGTPDVAWNGSVYLVTWTEDAQVRARRLSPDGVPLGESFFVMDGYTSDVAALADTFLVVGTYQTIGPQFIHPFGARVDGATGAVLDSPPISLGQYFANNLDVVAFDGRWLATWQRNFSHDDPGAEIRATFIEPDGSTAGDFSVGFGGRPDARTSRRARARPSWSGGPAPTARPIPTWWRGACHLPERSSTRGASRSRPRRGTRPSPPRSGPARSSSSCGRTSAPRRPSSTSARTSTRRGSPRTEPSSTRAPSRCSTSSRRRLAQSSP